MMHDLWRKVFRYATDLAAEIQIDALMAMA